MVVLLSLPIGCATFGGGGGSWQDNVPRLKSDINIFSKLATRITLNELDVSAQDIGILEGYLIALKDLLAVPGQPNFAGARLLVAEKLPQKYQIYGLTIIDVIDRYLQSANLNVTEDQELIIELVLSAIDGALDGVQEFGN